MDVESPPSGRTGRPRRSPRAPLDGEPRAEILAVATRLFAERGVTASTMAEIARRSGLQQSSLYYYFRNKEQVLDEIVAEANRAPLALVEQVRADGGALAVQLYRIIRADVMALCALPYDLNEVHRLAARDPASFDRYWRERDRLVSEVAAVIADGTARGELRDVEPRIAALTVLANDEGTQNWMRAGERGRARPAAGPSRAGLGGPHAVGSFLADLTVRGLLVESGRLESIRNLADALDARAMLDP